MSPAVRGKPDALNRCEAPPCARADASPDERRADTELQKLASVAKPFVRYTPDLSFLRVRADANGAHDLVYTLIHNKALYNVAFMFFEQDRRDVAADTMSVVPGYIGSYPNFFFDVALGDLGSFVSELAAVDAEAEFTALVERYGVRRSSPRFWQSSDWFNQRLAQTKPIEAGLLDLNRYDDY